MDDGAIGYSLVNISVPVCGRSDPDGDKIEAVFWVRPFECGFGANQVVITA